MQNSPLRLRRFGSWALVATWVATLGTACGSTSEDADGSGGGSTGGSASGSGGKGSGGSSTGTGGRAASGGARNSGGAPASGGLGGGFPFGGEFSGIGGFSFGAGGWMNGNACPESEPTSGDACSSPEGSGGQVGLNDFLCNYGSAFCVCNPQANTWLCAGF